jgi:predicted O-methyltransferase YrrM
MNIMDRLLRKIAPGTFARLDQEILNNYRQMEGYVNLVSTIKPVRPFPPMRKAVIAPDLANILYSTIMTYRPRMIVECGSGVSTLITAYGLKSLGAGHVITMDHEASYAAHTREMIAQHGLSSWVTVLHTPLVEQTVQGRKCFWYDLSSLKFEGEIDLLFVDGPPAVENGLARYPALPLLYSRLSPSAVVILDDAARPGEKEVKALWSKEFATLYNQSLPTEKGTEIFSKTPFLLP